MTPVAVSPATPRELLDAARAVCRRPDQLLVGCWPRVSAILTRQALEQTMDDYWQRRLPAVAQCRAVQPKLLCLPTYLDGDIARQAHHTWIALSGACHVGAYAIDPTLHELDAWADDVERIVDMVEHHVGGHRQQVERS